MESNAEPAPRSCTKEIFDILARSQAYGGDNPSEAPEDGGLVDAVASTCFESDIDMVSQLFSPSQPKNTSDVLVTCCHQK